MPDKTYEIELNGKKFQLPVVPISDEFSIAVVDMLVQHQLVLPAAMELQDQINAKKLKFDVIVAPECKSIPLAYELATDYDCDLVILRKSEKKYNQDFLAYPVKSITTEGVQLLHLNEIDATKLTGKYCLILDDVVSTGGTLDSIKRMMEIVQCTVVGVAAVAAEGNAADEYPGLMYAVKTPLIPND
ncbi:MAG: adenine phosphoribosyltransferase [Lachnospiraceae bacterium]|nr:adenine phosphoribosyltransferase [Lachnospiraceae bacterium]